MEERWMKMSKSLPSPPHPTKQTNKKTSSLNGLALYTDIPALESPLPSGYAFKRIMLGGLQL